MASLKNLMSTAMVVFVVVLMATTSFTEAQPPMQSCVSKLVVCAEFINNATVKPDATCCSSIKDAVEHDLPCLCNFYNSPGGLSSFGVNISEALRVSRDCNVNTDLSACNSTALSPSQVPPPGVPGGDSGAGRVAWTGITSLLLLLFWASVMLY